MTKLVKMPNRKVKNTTTISLREMGKMFPEIYEDRLPDSSAVKKMEDGYDANSPKATWVKAPSVHSRFGSFSTGLVASPTVEPWSKVASRDENLINIPISKYRGPLNANIANSALSVDSSTVHSSPPIGIDTHIFPAQKGYKAPRNSPIYRVDGATKLSGGKQQSDEVTKMAWTGESKRFEPVYNDAYLSSSIEVNRATNGIMQMHAHLPADTLRETEFDYRGPFARLQHNKDLNSTYPYAEPEVYEATQDSYSTHAGDASRSSPLLGISPRPLLEKQSHFDAMYPDASWAKDSFGGRSMRQMPRMPQYGRDAAPILVQESPSILPNVSPLPVCKMFLSGECEADETCNFLHILAVPTQNQSYKYLPQLRGQFSFAFPHSTTVYTGMNPSVSASSLTLENAIRDTHPHLPETSLKDPVMSTLPSLMPKPEMEKKGVVREAIGSNAKKGTVLEAEDVSRDEMSGLDVFRGSGMQPIAGALGFEAKRVELQSTKGLLKVTNDNGLQSPDTVPTPLHSQQEWVKRVNVVPATCAAQQTLRDRGTAYALKPSSASTRHQSIAVSRRGAQQPSEALLAVGEASLLSGGKGVPRKDGSFFGSEDIPKVDRRLKNNSRYARAPPREREVQQSVLPLAASVDPASLIPHPTFANGLPEAVLSHENRVGTREDRSSNALPNHADTVAANASSESKGEGFDTRQKSQPKGPQEVLYIGCRQLGEVVGGMPKKISRKKRHSRVKPSLARKSNSLKEVWVPVAPPEATVSSDVKANLPKDPETVFGIHSDTPVITKDTHTPMMNEQTLFSNAAVDRVTNRGNIQCRPTNKPLRRFSTLSSPNGEAAALPVDSKGIPEAKSELYREDTLLQVMDMNKSKKGSATPYMGASLKLFSDTLSTIRSSAESHPSILAREEREAQDGGTYEDIPFSSLPKDSRCEHPKSIECTVRDERRSKQKQQKLKQKHNKDTVLPLYQPPAARHIEEGTVTTGVENKMPIGHADASETSNLRQVRRRARRSIVRRLRQ